MQMNEQLTLPLALKRKVYTYLVYLKKLYILVKGVPKNLVCGNWHVGMFKNPSPVWNVKLWPKWIWNNHKSYSSVSFSRCFKSVCVKLSTSLVIWSTEQTELISWTWTLFFSHHRVTQRRINATAPTVRFLVPREFLVELVGSVQALLYTWH